MASHFSIFPSPAKKKRSLTDFDKCIICQKVGKNKLCNISVSSVSTIEEIAGILCNDTAYRLRTELQSTEEFLEKQPKWHKNCQASWLKKRTSLCGQAPLPVNIEQTSQNTEQNPVNSLKLPLATTPIKKEAECNFDFQMLCVICGKAKLAGDKKHEKLSVIEGSPAKMNLFTTMQVAF